MQERTDKEDTTWGQTRKHGNQNPDNVPQSSGDPNSPNDGQHEVVDNYSDNLNKGAEKLTDNPEQGSMGLADEPDKGWNSDAQQPLSPEDFANAQKAARQPSEQGTGPGA